MGRSGKIPRLPILFAIVCMSCRRHIYCHRRIGITIADIMSAGFLVRTPACPFTCLAGARFPGAHLRAHNYVRDPDSGTTNTRYLAHPCHGLVSSRAPLILTLQNNPQCSVWVSTLFVVCSQSGYPPLSLISTFSYLSAPLNFPFQTFPHRTHTPFPLARYIFCFL